MQVGQAGEGSGGNLLMGSGDTRNSEASGGKVSILAGSGGQGGSVDIAGGVASASPSGYVSITAGDNFVNSGAQASM